MFFFVCIFFVFFFFFALSQGFAADRVFIYIMYDRTIQHQRVLSGAAQAQAADSQDFTTGRESLMMFVIFFLFCALSQGLSMYCGTIQHQRVL